MKANNLHVVGLLHLERAWPILRQFLACRSVGYYALRCCAKTTRCSWFSVPSVEGASPGWIFSPLQAFTDAPPPSAKTSTDHTFQRYYSCRPRSTTRPNLVLVSSKSPPKRRFYDSLRFQTRTSRGQCRNGHFYLGSRLRISLSAFHVCRRCFTSTGTTSTLTYSLIEFISGAHSLYVRPHP